MIKECSPRRPSSILKSTQAILLLAMVFVTALLHHTSLAPKVFMDARSYLQVFTTVAYGYSPLVPR